MLVKTYRIFTTNHNADMKRDTKQKHAGVKKMK